MFNRRMIYTWKSSYKETSLKYKHLSHATKMSNQVLSIIVAGTIEIHLENRVLKGRPSKINPNETTGKGLYPEKLPDDTKPYKWLISPRCSTPILLPTIFNKFNTRISLNHNIILLLSIWRPACLPDALQLLNVDKQADDEIMTAFDLWYQFKKLYQIEMQGRTLKVTNIILIKFWILINSVWSACLSWHCICNNIHSDDVSFREEIT